MGYLFFFQPTAQNALIQSLLKENYICENKNWKRQHKTFFLAYTK